MSVQKHDAGVSPSLVVCERVAGQMASAFVYLFSYFETREFLE